MTMSARSKRLSTEKPKDNNLNFTVKEDNISKSLSGISSINKPHQPQEKENELDDNNGEQNIENGDNNAINSEVEKSHEKKIQRNGKKANLKHPFIGKRAKVNYGSGAGIVAKIIAIKSRGWWKLDHPNLDGVVHSRRCSFVDAVPEEDMVAFYQKRGMKYRGTPVLNTSTRRPSRSTRLPKITNSIGSSSQSENGGSSEDEAPYKKRACNKKSRILYKTRKRKCPVQDPVYMRSLIDNAPKILKESAHYEHCHQQLQYRVSPKESVLPPVVFQFNEDKIPSTLKHMAPPHMLDIFDRKTGMILSGKDRISVQDLPHVLRQHAEYEPIIPPPPLHKSYSSVITRQGRSSKDVRVSAEVNPQYEITDAIRNQRDNVSVFVNDRPKLERERNMKANPPGDSYNDHRISTSLLENSLLSTKNQEKVEMNGNHHKTHTDISEKNDIAICSIFQEALEATIKAESQLLDTQIEALRDQEDCLQKKLQGTEDAGQLTKYQQELELLGIRGERQRIERDLNQASHESVETIFTNIKPNSFER